MRLHCLGTAGYHPNETRHTSCFFLPESGIALDAGSGIFRLTELIETDSLDILLSHAHLDHTFGLTFLLDILHQRPVERLRIWGEAAKLDAIQNHLFSELIFPVQLGADWNPIDELDSFSVNEARVTWQRQNHPGGSVAYRIEWPKVPKMLVYATDTTGDTGQAAVDWRQGADLMMHECYFRDAQREWAETTGHCWTSRVAELAKVCQPRKLLITHINPLETAEDPVDLASIRQAFRGEVELAQDGGLVEF